MCVFRVQAAAAAGLVILPVPLLWDLNAVIRWLRVRAASTDSSSIAFYERTTKEKSPHSMAMSSIMVERMLALVRQRPQHIIVMDSGSCIAMAFLSTYWNNENSEHELRVAECRVPCAASSPRIFNNSSTVFIGNWFCTNKMYGMVGLNCFFCFSFFKFSFRWQNVSEASRAQLHFAPIELLNSELFAFYALIIFSSE